MDYPLADKDHDGWYSDGDYEKRGGRMVSMKPQDYLKRVRPLEIDDASRDNIDDLKNHIQSGRKLDPLKIYADGKEDGRHRAHAAAELGIKRVPVVSFHADDSITSKVRKLSEQDEDVSYVRDFPKICKADFVLKYGTKQHQDKLVHSKHPMFRAMLASATEHEDHLDQLANDKDARVRARVEKRKSPANESIVNQVRKLIMEEEEE